MTAAATMPLTDITRFLLQQTALRASLLQSSFGFAADGWDDLRQELALDCLRRLPRFDNSRGNWQGFVRGVVRNHACVLATRQIRRPDFQPLETIVDAGHHDDHASNDASGGPAIDFRAELELSLDVQRLLATLPEDLQTIARCLCEMPISSIREKTGLSQAQVNQKVARIRGVFVAAGITPRAFRTKGGVR